MKKKRVAGASTSVDPDDAPELTDQWFKQADLYVGAKLVRRGRPKSKHPKRAVTRESSPPQQSR